MLVFGSRARGDQLLDSDYDLILISPAFEGIAWPDRVREVMSLWHLDIDLQPLCYTPEGFARKSAEISIVAEAIRDGVAVTTGS